jgi:5-formyltetrahydrofolate cyclo-ligase
MRRPRREVKMQEKSEIRKYIDNLKRKISEDKRKHYDSLIFENVINNSFYENASTIFIFVSYNNEVDTHNIIKHSLNIGKTVCVPKVISKNEGMKAVKIENFDELKTGTYGILEPADTSREIKKENIDAIFLPGVAFDLNGGRIGYGAGFYDRFLKDVKSETSRIALCYSFQVLDSVPMNPLDEFMDRIITEKGVHTMY